MFVYFSDTCKFPFSEMSSEFSKHSFGSNFITFCGALIFRNNYKVFPASLVAQTVKNLPEMQDTWVQSLGWEDPLEEGVATHSSILAWRIPWTEELGGLQSMGSQRVGHN